MQTRNPFPYHSLPVDVSLTKYQKHRKVNSATGDAIPQESRDIYPSPYKQDLIGIKSYMAEKVFSAEHGDSLDHLRYEIRYEGMLPS